MIEEIDAYHDLSNPFICLSFKSRDEWLKGRDNGIGGSDAAAALGISPWKSNVDLWRIKTGREAQDDISSKPVVVYGTKAEQIIRDLYTLKHEDTMYVQYLPNVILQNKEYPLMFYSADGLLIEKDTGRKGILEIKTTHINRSQDGEKWKDRIPDYYYAQILHGLNVTGFDFVDLIAELNYGSEFSTIRTYHMERSEIKEDLEYELKGIDEFCYYLAVEIEPPLKLRTF